MKRTFEHLQDVVLPELKAETTENGRFYETPEGNRYPSVTTVLGSATDSSWKEAWIARVGKDEADRISRMATTRGTAVHELVEQYLRNNTFYTKGHMPSNIASFSYIRTFLDQSIGKIAGLELPLYSDTLRTAGRVDCVAEWNNIWSIVDFKTSKREKSRDDIHSYFLQESAYAMLMWERTGIMCKQLVTVMTVDDGRAQVFIEKTRDWLPKFVELRNSILF